MSETDLLSNFVKMKWLVVKSHKVISSWRRELQQVLGPGRTFGHDRHVLRSVIAEVAGWGTTPQNRPRLPPMCSPLIKFGKMVNYTISSRIEFTALSQLKVCA